MFSRSVAKSIKSPQDTAADIAARAYPTSLSVRRSPACSGPYSYQQNRFRTSDHDAGNHAKNLAIDYEHFITGGNVTLLPYHHAIAALHHTYAARSVAYLRNQTHVIRQLTSNPNPNLAPQPAPIPFELDYARSQHLLDKMQFALPPPHPKRLVIFRGRGLGPMNFDPTQLPSERRFVKTCCNQLSSADTCCCHVGTSNESLRYVNACGECMNVCYYERKNDYFNITYRMWGDDSDREKDVPHSPKSEVSDSEVFPCMVNDFENEIANAFEATRSGFTYMWKDKNLQRRFERRQRRRNEKLVSGELPKYGLIVINVETNEIRAAKPHPIPGEDEDMCQRDKTRYEDIRDTIHKQAIEQGVITEPKPQPHPQRDDLLPFLVRRKIQHMQHQQSITHIQRPLTDTNLTIARGIARAQVTAISALHPHQRLRTIAGSLITLLAIRLSCERTNISAILPSTETFHETHYLHNLHHDGIHRILRRASGSQNRAIKIAAPYTDFASNLQKNLPVQLETDLKKYMAARFKAPPRPHPDFWFGPYTFHKAEFYACKCLELIGTHDDPAAAARWAYLSAKVQSVRRGELTPYQVIADPFSGSGSDSDSTQKDTYWVYAVHYTFHLALKNYLEANVEWLNVCDRPNRDAEGNSVINPGSGVSIFWPCLGSRETRIRINGSRSIQTTQMVHAMYRFIIKASRVLSPEFIGVFGFDNRFIKTIISRAKHLATCDGDESSALTFGHFFPCLMTPNIHLDIFVGGNVFQHPELYVKMSDPVFGELKKEFRDVIPSRHTGVIDRATLMAPPTIRRRE